MRIFWIYALYFLEIDGIVNSKLLNIIIIIILIARRKIIKFEF